jgi:hypothetical protein
MPEDPAGFVVIIRVRDVGPIAAPFSHAEALTVLGDLVREAPSYFRPSLDLGRRPDIMDGLAGMARYALNKVGWVSFWDEQVRLWAVPREAVIAVTVQDLGEASPAGPRRSIGFGLDVPVA